MCVAYHSAIVRLIPICAIFASLSPPLTGCSAADSSGATTCSRGTSIQNPSGALHGQPCSSNDDCLYGRCHASQAIADFRFCTKACACGPNSACGDDDGAGATFACQYLDPDDWPGESERWLCAQVCETVVDCPAGYTTCKRLSGERSVCLVR